MSCIFLTYATFICNFIKKVFLTNILITDSVVQKYDVNGCWHDRNLNTAYAILLKLCKAGGNPDSVLNESYTLESSWHFNISSGIHMYREETSHTVQQSNSNYSDSKTARFLTVKKSCFVLCRLLEFTCLKNEVMVVFLLAPLSSSSSSNLQ
jgi:hypothetical protein